MQALRCIQFPLLDHADLLQSPTTSEQNLGPTSEYAKMLTGFLGLEDSSTKKDPSFKLSAAVMKEVKRLIKDQLHEAPVQDKLYSVALLQFYETVIKKKAGFFVAAGSSYEDLLHIFVQIVNQELRKGSMEGNETQILDPYGDVDAAVLARVEKFVQLIKNAASSKEELETVERRLSRMAIQRDVAVEMDQLLHVDSEKLGKPLSRQRSRQRSRNQESEEVGVTLDGNKNENQECSTAMAEWLKKVE